MPLKKLRQKGEFADEVRSRALANSGELLMSQLMNLHFQESRNKVLFSKWFRSMAYYYG